jgi:hypothetical protein
VHTPRFCGEDCSAGTVLRAFTRVRGLRINWLIVGIALIHPSFDRPILGRATFPSGAFDQPLSISRLRPATLGQPNA